MFFQSLMSTVVEIDNVIKVTNQPGFMEQLETLQQRYVYVKLLLNINFWMLSNCKPLSL